MKKNIFLMGLIFVLLLTGCGSKEDKLVGTWYREGEEDAAFILYDDGTCEILGEYGVGTWSIVNENQFKLTNFYGESEVATIESIDNDKFVVSSEGYEVVFVREASE